MIKDTYTRKAKLVRVIDGDTIIANIDLGCHVNLEMTCRLDGINSPEKATFEGIKAKKYLEELLPVGTNLTVRTIKDRTEKYGRYLAIVFAEGVVTSINDLLKQAGLAIEYHGEKRV